MSFDTHSRLSHIIITQFILAAGSKMVFKHYDLLFIAPVTGKCSKMLFFHNLPASSVCVNVFEEEIKINNGRKVSSP